MKAFQSIGERNSWLIEIIDNIIDYSMRDILNDPFGGDRAGTMIQCGSTW